MSRDKQKTEIPTEKLALYDRLIRERPHIARKGAGLPYTSVNGHMFSFLSASGALALRLPAGTREAFLEKHGTALFVAHGSVLKEYVEVPEKLFANTGELLAYLDQSYSYAQGLKPKQPKKKSGGMPKKRPPMKTASKKPAPKKTALKKTAPKKASSKRSASKRSARKA